MAILVDPTTWLGSGYTNGTNQIIFNTKENATPITDELTNAIGNPTTGDVRGIAFSLLNKMYRKWVLLAPADRPTKMVIVRNTSEDAAGNLVRTFSISFTLDPTISQVVVAE